MVEQKYNLYLVRFCILNWSIKYKRARYLDIYIHISITSIYTLSQLMATSLLCGRWPSSCRGGRGRTWGTWSARRLPARRAGRRPLVLPPAQPLLPLHWTEGETEGVSEKIWMCHYYLRSSKLTEVVFRVRVRQVPGLQQVGSRRGNWREETQVSQLTGRFLPSWCLTMSMSRLASEFIEVLISESTVRPSPAILKNLVEIWIRKIWS